MNFLSYDGILAQTIRHIVKLIALNICFILCCIPVFTAGAAITSLYAVFLHGTLEQSPFRRFFHAFQSNFKQATVIWFVFLVLGLILGLDCYFLWTYQFPGKAILQSVTCIMAFVYFSAMCFAFPLQAHFENKIYATMRNALVLGVTMFLHSVIMLVVAGLPIVIFFVSVDLFIYALPFWALFGATLSIQMNAMIVNHIFKKMLPAEHELINPDNSQKL